MKIGVTEQIEEYKVSYKACALILFFSLRQRTLIVAINLNHGVNSIHVILSNVYNSIDTLLIGQTKASLDWRV